MYFWSYKKLAEDLRDGQVTSLHKTKYLLAFIFLYALGGYETNLYDFLGFVFITVALTYFLYRINKKGDDQNFIERYVILGFPITVRAFVIFAPLTILIIVSMYALFYRDPWVLNDILDNIASLGFFHEFIIIKNMETFFASITLIILICYYFYTRMKYCIEIVSGNRSHDKSALSNTSSDPRSAIEK